MSDLKYKIKYNEFDPNRLVPTSVEGKMSKARIDPANPQAGLQQVPYQVYKILYNYEITDPKTGKTRDVVAPLAVEAPELFTPAGVVSKMGQLGYETASIFTIFNMGNEEVRDFCSFNKQAPGFWFKLHSYYMNKMWENRQQIKLIAGLPMMAAMAGVFPVPIFVTYDQATGEVNQNANPTKFFELLSSGKRGSPLRKETLFNTPRVVNVIAGKKIYEKLEWNMLESVEMRFEPVITFEHLHIGNKITYKCKITSAIVKDIIPANSESSQTEALGRHEQDEQLQQTLAAQIEALTNRLQNMPAPSQTPNPQLEEKQEAIQGQGQGQLPQISYQPSQQSQQLQMGYQPSQIQIPQTPGFSGYQQPQNPINMPQVPGGAMAFQGQADLEQAMRGRAPMINQGYQQYGMPGMMPGPIQQMPSHTG